MLSSSDISRLLGRNDKRGGEFVSEEIGVDNDESNEGLLMLLLLLLRDGARHMGSTSFPPSWRMGAKKAGS